MHVRPDGVEPETERFTVPVKLFRAVRLIVEVPESPARIWLGVAAPAVMVKSGTGAVVVWNVMAAVTWARF